MQNRVSVAKKAAVPESLFVLPTIPPMVGLLLATTRSHIYIYSRSHPCQPVSKPAAPVAKSSRAPSFIPMSFSIPHVFLELTEMALMLVQVNFRLPANVSRASSEEPGEVPPLLHLI